MRGLLIILALLLSACKTQEETTAIVQSQNNSAPVQDLCAALQDLSGEWCPPAKVNVQHLTIDFLGAGVQTVRRMTAKHGNLFYLFVRLYFHASLERDYLEILRCDGDKRSKLTCSDGESLDKLTDTAEVQQALDDPFGTTVNRLGLRDCWASIAASPYCVALGGAQGSDAQRTGRIYAAEHYVDVSASVGQEFFYIARPCVHAEHADELSSGNKNCAQQLHVSNMVKEIRGYRIDKELRDARERVAALAARLNRMTEEAYRITLDFSRALAMHETSEIKRERGKRLRQGIAMVTGQIAGAAGAVYAVGASSIGSGLEAGQALGSAFADIIASKDDYPQSCVECLRLRAELIEVVGDVRRSNLRADVQSLLNDAEEGSAGYLYQQVLDEYAEALSALDKLQSEKIGKKSEAELLDELGSSGGPP